MPAARMLMAAAVLAVTAGACRTTSPSPSGPPGQAAVVDVVDGDTIDVRIAGHRERVRLLGIDTPETVDPRKPVQCFGTEASRRTKALLPPGTLVRLERDAEPRDIYGRLLAYVRRVDGTFVNLALLEEGYAHVLSIPPNIAYASTFAVAAHGAQAAGRGLWSACPAEAGR